MPICWKYTFLNYESTPHPNNNTVLPFATDTAAGLETTVQAELTGVAGDALLEESDCMTEGKKKK